MRWYSLLGTKTTESKETILHVEVPSESPWFDGHFPDDPTLPGIAQLEMAVDAIRITDKENDSVAGFRKVRFKRIIRPGERLKVITKPKESEKGTYTFRILVGNEVACNGVLLMKEGKE